MNPRTAIDLAAFLVGCTHLDSQAPVVTGMFGFCPLAPGIEARRRHVQRSAERSDREIGLLRADELKPQVLSFAKKAFS
jgi:hypothetical protein